MRCFIRIVFTVVLWLVFTRTVFAISDISSARELGVYTSVEIVGVVTVPPGVFGSNLLQIQDETGGITIFGQGLDLSKKGIITGDVLRVKGKVINYRGNVEVSVTSLLQLTILGTASLPRPAELKTVQVNSQDLQGLLVTVTGKLVAQDRTEYYIDDGSGKAIIYLRHPGFELRGTGALLAVTGVLGKFDSAYELWPRWQADVEISDSTPPVVELITVQATDIIDLVFSESVSDKSIITSTTIKVSGVSIVSVDLSATEDIVRLRLAGPAGEGPIVISGIMDAAGNAGAYAEYPIVVERESRVLFDVYHGENSGNADWTVEAAYSDYADALKSKGYIVNSLERSMDYLTLAQYDAFVLPEPNTPLSRDQIAALERYVTKGGSLFLMADHGGADRDGDGWDAVEIFNVFTPGLLGIMFDGNNLLKGPATEILPTPFTAGVERIGLWNGSSITIIDGDVSVAAKVYGRSYVVYGSAGEGKFVAIGDSSPFEDGSGTTGKTLYNGWKMYDDAILGVNIIDWLVN